MIAASRSSGLEQKSASKKIRIKPFLFLALFAFTFLTSTFMTTQSASAATTAESKANDPTWRVKSFLYYRAIANCFKNAPMADGDGFTSGGRIDNANVKSGLWFGKGSTNYTDRASPIGVYFKKMANVGADGKINCGEESKQLVVSALSFWGITAPELLCNIGMQRVDMGKLSIPDCIASSKQMERPAGSGSLGWDQGAAAFRNYIGKVVYDTKAGVEPGLKDHEWYVYYKGVVANSCIPNITTQPSSTSKGNDNQFGYNNVKWVDISKATVSEMVVTGSYNGALKPSESVTTRPGSGPEYATVDFSCSDIITNMNKYAEAYAKWAFGNKDAATQTEVNAGNDIAGEGGTDEGTSCRVEGVGWILCPLANAMAGITDALFEGVTAFMKVEPLSLSPTNNPLYTAWSVMRSVANVAFVIVFLIIIFSQLTSAGVSNYGVKKLLPRLIVGAILVNVSFFICAIAVDASNILGVGVQQVFEGIAKQTVNADNTNVETWGSMVIALLSGSAVAAGVGISIAAFTSTTIWAALAALLPLLVGALFALVIAFLILLARQALIIMLIVLAPLAFVAFLLPNTEDLYKKWQKLFMTLLLLFPMLSVVFGASMLASVILRQTSSTQAGTFIGLCFYIGSFAVQAIPFFITPLLINLSQGVLSRFAGLVNNKNKGPFDRLRKTAQGHADNVANKGYARKLATNSKLFGGGARRRARRGAISSSLGNEAKRAEATYIADATRNNIGGLQSSLAGSSNAEAMQRVMASAINTEEKLSADEVNAAKVVIEDAKLSGKERQILATTGSFTKDGKTYTGDTMQKAAIQEQMRTGSMDDIYKIVEASGSSLGKFSQTISQGVAANGHANKDPALGGKTLDSIAQGKIGSTEDLNMAIASAASDGKYTAEALAGMHNDARARVIGIAQTKALAGDPSLLNALKSAATGIRSSAEINGRVAGNEMANSQIEGLLQAFTAASAAAAAPPAAPTRADAIPETQVNLSHDDQGRATPGGAGDDYHDGMSR